MVGGLESTLKLNLPHADEPYILGVSGGRDSMVLADLLLRLNYRFILAHVNYGLRPEASDETALVQKWACDNNIPLYVKFASKKQLKASAPRGFQDAARQYRYIFFRQVLESTNGAGIVTAHHQDDQTETFLIKLIQGGGLLSLGGMEAHHNSLFKPMLDISRDEISAYAKEKDVPYLDDTSNFTDAYMRNRIRNEVLPLLQDIHPGALKGVQRALANLNEYKSDAVIRLKAYEGSRLTSWRNQVYMPWPSTGRRGPIQDLSLFSRIDQGSGRGYLRRKEGFR